MDSRPEVIKYTENGPTPRLPKAHQRAYTPKVGYERNPLLQHRNVICGCPKGRKEKLKAKRCCGQVQWVTHDNADKIRAYLRFIGKGAA